MYQVIFIDHDSEIHCFDSTIKGEVRAFVKDLVRRQVPSIYCYNNGQPACEFHFIANHYEIEVF